MRPLGRFIDWLRLGEECPPWDPFRAVVSWLVVLVLFVAFCFAVWGLDDLLGGDPGGSDVTCYTSVCEPD